MINEIERADSSDDSFPHGNSVVSTFITIVFLQ